MTGPGGGAAAYPLDLAGWSQRSIFGTDPADRWWAQPWRDTGTADEPDVWLGYVPPITRAEQLAHRQHYRRDHHRRRPGDTRRDDGARDGPVIGPAGEERVAAVVGEAIRLAGFPVGLADPDDLDGDGRRRRHERLMDAAREHGFFARFDRPVIEGAWYEVGRDVDRTT